MCRIRHRQTPWIVKDFRHRREIHTVLPMCRAKPRVQLFRNVPKSEGHGDAKTPRPAPLITAHGSPGTSPTVFLRAPLRPLRLRGSILPLPIFLDSCVWGGALPVLIDPGHDVVGSGAWPQDPGDSATLAAPHPGQRILPH
jgi:hypothetical protein